MYCQPRKNILFERYRFNRRTQEPGETYDQYRTELRKIAENCDFGAITPDEILQDRLVFGIRDTKTRERLLRVKGLADWRANTTSGWMKVSARSSTPLDESQCHCERHLGTHWQI